MTNGDLSKLDKAEKREFISAVNDAILKQKYRIAIRRIFKQYTYNGTTYLIKEYAVQKRKKFLFFHWWDFCDRNEFKNFKTNAKKVNDFVIHLVSIPVLQM